MMRLLIYGAGVIGSFYAALFSRAGYNTTVYARGKRLETLKRASLLYEHKGQLHSAYVEVIDRVAGENHFDYIFLTVKENQVHTALRELRSNCSPNKAIAGNIPAIEKSGDPLSDRKKYARLAAMSPRDGRPDCRRLLCGRASQGGVAGKSGNAQYDKAAETQFQDTPPWESIFRLATKITSKVRVIE